MSRPDMMFHFFCLLSMALIMARRLAEAHMQCGTHDPSSFELKLDQLRTHNFKHSERGRKLIADSCEELCVQCVDIDVYFHLSAIPQTSTSDYILPQPIESVSRFVREDPTLIRGDFSTVAEIYSLIEDNMRVLNERFAESPFSFTWRNSNPINPSVSADLSFAQLDINSIFNDDSVVKELHTGDSTTLNVFLTYAQCSDDADPRTGQITTNCDILGAAVFPSYQQANRDIDGVYVNYSTLTGGGFPQNDEGLTLVHEVGHWLGLYHTFQESASASDPCSPSNENDFVADTPTQAGSSQSLYECSLTHYEGESLPDSCPDLAGSDPVFNYMNYVSDEACWPPGVGEFTCGQYERMYTQWLLYRQHNETCQSNEMEIKIVVEFNRFFQRENVFYLFNDADEVLLNSTRDFDSLLTGIVQDQLRVDFCAPRGTYRLVFLDALQDGFEEGGAYEVYVDGSLVDRVVGDFGRSSVTEFGPPDAIDAPSRIPSRAEATAPTVSPVFLSPTLMPTNLPSIAPVLLSSAAPSTSPTKNPGGTVTEIPIAGEIGATSIPTPTSPHVPKVASITSVPIGLSHTEPELPSGVRNKWHFCTLVLSVLVLIPIPYL